MPTPTLHRILARAGASALAVISRVEDVWRPELRSWQTRADRIDPEALALAEAITAGVVAKLLHGPTVRLKQAAGTADADLYGDALRPLAAHQSRCRRQRWTARP